jgi:hypothetical protein
MLNNLVGFNKFSLMIIESFAFVLVARHRREIQQLIDSARDRTRVASSNLPSTRYEPSIPTPFRPSSTASRSRQPLKPDLIKPKQPSWFNRSGKAIGSFWKTYKDVIINALKTILVGLLLGGGLILLKMKAGDLIPHRQGKFFDFLYVNLAIESLL